MTLKVKSTIYFIVGLILLLLLSTLLFSLSVMNRLKGNVEVQGHTRVVIITLKNNLTDLLNAETGERGFIITSDTNYLQPYSTSLENIHAEVAQLRILLQDNPSQQHNLKELEAYIDQKLAYIENLIFVKRIGNPELVKEIMISNKGKYLMDKIRLVNNKMQLEEEKLFVTRKENTDKSITKARVVFMVEGISALAIILFLAIFVVTELNRRTKAERTIISKNTELERKNREIEQFAYAASHDLQEPLRSISNFSSILAGKLESHPDNSSREYLNFIRQAAKRMSNLIFDLLEYSRIGNEKQKSKIDTNKLVNDVLVNMAASIAESGAKVNVSKLPVVLGYTYLTSLFQNLVSNAIKFQKPGIAPLIDISATNLGKEFLFLIKDNGIGIEMAYHERIFTIFQRLHTREEFPGTGIGLSQCKKIVELHGGRMWVQSEPGKGSAFYFTIPNIKTNQS